MYQEFACNLGAHLVTSARMWSSEIDNHHLLYAPDFPGQPIVVSKKVYDILRCFDTGATVGQVLSDALPQVDFDFFISAVGFLEEKGFLRAEPDPPAYSISVSSHEKPPTEMTVWLHVTNDCNLGCDYCFVRDKACGEFERAGLTGALDDIVDTAQTNALRKVVIKLAGGEPTLAVNLMEYAYDYVSERIDPAQTEVRFAVLTNGTSLNARILEFLQRPGVGVGISVDGFGKDHDAHRVFKATGRGSWSSVSRHIERLLALGIKPYIMATLTPESMSGIVNLVEWLLTHDLAARLNVVRPYFGADVDPHQRRRSADALAATATRAFDEALSFVERWREPVDVINRINICELSFDHPLNGPACGIGRSHVIINHKARLSDCVMNLESAATACEPDLLRAVRKTVHSTCYEPDSVARLQDCLQCRWFSTCGGGCPTFNARVTGHAFTRSPLCNFYQAVIPRYLACVARQQMRFRTAVGEVAVGQPKASERNIKTRGASNGEVERDDRRAREGRQYHAERPAFSGG